MLEERPRERLEQIVYTETAPTPEKTDRRWKTAIKLLVLVLVVAIGFSILNGGLVSDKPVNDGAPGDGKSDRSWFSSFSILGSLKYLAESSDQKLKGEDSDRINILLLGIGGKNHDGGLLTDTIMLASLKPSTKQVALISIPRDLSVPLDGYGWRKVNSINAMAEMANPGSGGEAASQAIGHLLNLPIDYYVTLDFTGFIKVVDELGGITVQVDNTLDDYSYPILGQETNPNYNARWEHLHVDAGLQQMNGALALKYARSRHAYGPEGSDFARARRQQKILEAVKDKILSLNVLFKPRMISNIIDAYKENISTNLSVWEMVKLWGMFKDVTKDKIANQVIDNSPNGLLADRIGEDGAYLLLPKAGDFSQIEYLVKNVFADAPTEAKAVVKTEQAKIEVRNGTWINGLASHVALDLEKYGFEVVNIGNASQRNFQKSVIYDLAEGSKPDALAVLKEKTRANIAYGLPEWLKTDMAKAVAEKKTQAKADFVLILGEEANNLN